MYRRGFSLLKTSIAVVIFLSLASLATFVILAWVPRNLQDVNRTSTSEGEVVVDLKQRIEKAIEESYPIEISEAELNLYIADRLTLTQSPIVDDFVQINGIYVDLLPGVIDLTIERSYDYPGNIQDDGSKKLTVLPIAQTLSMQLEVSSEQTPEGAVKTLVSFPGGNFGKAPAPGRLVVLVKPSFDVIAEFFQEELHLGYHQMTRIAVEDGVLKLDPRPLELQQP